MTLVQHLASILLQGVVVLATSKLVPGFKVDRYGTAVAIAIVYGVLSWLLKGILTFLTFPFILITFGLFSIVLNAFLLWMTTRLVSGVKVDGKGALLVSAILIAIGQSIVAWMIG